MTGAAQRLAGLLGLVGVALSGCSKPPEPAPTVSWYIDHPEEMRTKLSWCADEVSRQQLPECLNAAAARGRLQMGKMKDEPALNWNQPDLKKP
jgi:hypothetical protein